MITFLVVIQMHVQMCCDEEVPALLQYLEIKRLVVSLLTCSRLLPIALHLPSLSFSTSHLGSGRIPGIWKVALVTPIPKGGDATDPKNYRLLPNFLNATCIQSF